MPVTMNFPRLLEVPRIGGRDRFQQLRVEVVVDNHDIGEKPSNPSPCFTLSYEAIDQEGLPRRPPRSTALSMPASS